MKISIDVTTKTVGCLTFKQPTLCFDIYTASVIKSYTREQESNIIIRVIDRDRGAAALQLPAVRRSTVALCSVCCALLCSFILVFYVCSANSRLSFISGQSYQCVLVTKREKKCSNGLSEQRCYLPRPVYHKNSATGPTWRSNNVRT